MTPDKGKTLQLRICIGRRLQTFSKSRSVPTPPRDLAAPCNPPTRKWTPELFDSTTTTWKSNSCSDRSKTRGPQCAKLFSTISASIFITTASPTSTKMKFSSGLSKGGSALSWPFCYTFSLTSSIQLIWVSTLRSRILKWNYRTRTRMLPWSTFVKPEMRVKRSRRGVRSKNCSDLPSSLIMFFKQTSYGSFWSSFYTLFKALKCRCKLKLTIWE